MSITVRDCLHLPSLRLTKVVGGEKGLDHIISSVSVVEFIDQHQDDLNIFSPNELILTAFYAFKDDTEKQCEALRYLSTTGTAGVVLFYVGEVIKDFPQELAHTAEQLGLPLIVISEGGRCITTYSDVIKDVMTAIIEDQKTAKDFLVSAKKRLEQIPTEHRSMETLLKMISDQYQCDLLLTNGNQLHFSSTYRPSKIQGDADLFYQLFRDTDSRYACKEMIYKMDFSHEGNGWNTLYAYNCNKPLSEHMLTEMCACTNLFTSVWGYALDLQSTCTLVPLILKEETAIAEKYLKLSGIPFTSISDLLIIHPNGADAQTLKTGIGTILKDAGKQYVADVVDENLVLLTSLSSELTDEVKTYIHEANLNASVFFHMGNADIAAIKKAYYDYCKNVSVLHEIFSHRRTLDMHDIILAEELMTLAKTSGQRKEYIQSIINTLDDDRDDLLETLAIYLIDCDAQLNKAAQTLYLHRNTVSYRLNKIKQMTNTDFSRMPAAYDFYAAAALWRMTAC